ncbi:Ni/Fe-hydrogenase, b-type cytochrome subunit [Sulfurovum sp. zt1-1]|uniref:Ni/Fe-hydrogenase, b-type cytochrome subunit n=1 Tax=Sulfurovum zhangzhouensis TaxID=3019067 RepID=A0ABT7QWC5_9BACT|nr:Ni/Fe-hydrogenase, b-type cytochrome subunit [Sulfurovum zhangzhouensis]MDM5271136.1 Ni/Fe-hydrogenase, b-type cytochrome subunit [Sulfurovum zhangzhouensis]
MKEQKPTYYPEFVYSGANRILHWLRAITITVLTVTGFYIADPFLTPSERYDEMKFAQWEMWHYIFGFILIAAAVIRIYLFFFGKGHKLETRSLKDVLSLKSWITQLKSYFFIGQLQKSGIYGPLQFVVYTMIMLLIILAVLTGLILYANVYHQGLAGYMYEPLSVVASWMGGLAYVRLIHHIVMWGFIIFVPIHIYMVVWQAIRFKHNALDVMFTGYDYHLISEEQKPE